MVSSRFSIALAVTITIGVAHQASAQTPHRWSADATMGGMVGQLDAGVFPATHFGVVLGARILVIPRYRHDRLTMIPVLFGLRIR
jgi:hypothetical protein